MMNSSNLILTTSPPARTAGKPCRTPSLPLRQRPLYGRKRHPHTVKERDSETGLYYYGARYLDSKTSRWLSGDPAMGEYVPEAPVNDEARKRNGNLPGMGGVFNYVNLHVYHYAGNNPVKFTDPDGERSLFFWEKISIATILGNGHSQTLNKVDLHKSRATKQQIVAAGAGYHSFTASQIDDMFRENPNIGKFGISLPDGSIYIPKNARGTSRGMKALLMHEIFHQLQYDDNSTRTRADTFQSLVGEQTSGGDPYGYTLGSFTTLQDMPTIESQGKLIEDFANGYYEGKRFFGRDRFSAETIARAQILKNSGIDSRAVNRVLASQDP